jgi:DNA-binding SARP family transcriptional activator/tetratricopeptide (TPR) repeat protein
VLPTYGTIGSLTGAQSKHAQALPSSVPLADAVRQLNGIPNAAGAITRAQGGQPLTPVDQGWLLVGASLHHQYAGQVVLQQQAIEQAVALGQQHADVPLHASALAFNAYMLINMQPERSLQLADMALAVSDELPLSNAAMRAKAYVLMQVRGDAVGAEHWFERATSLCLKLNFQRNLLYCYGGWIQSLVVLGRHARALEVYAELRRHCTPDAVNGWAEAAICCNVMIAAGQMDAAYAALARLERDAHLPFIEVFYCEHAAVLWLHDGQTDRAIGAARRVAELCRMTGNNVNTQMAQALLAQRDIAQAREWIDTFFEFGDAHRIFHARAEAHLVRAQVLYGLGDQPGASRELAVAIEQAEARKMLHVAARAALIRAGWQHAAGAPEAAAAFAEAVQRISAGGWGLIYEAERERAYPLLAAMSRATNGAVRAEATRALDALARVPPRPLHITGLGGFAVVQGTRHIPASQFEPRKAGELMRYLLLQGGRDGAYGAHRSAVIEALWPGQSSDGGAVALNKASSQLRRALEPELPEKFPSRYLLTGENLLTLRLPPGSTFDVEQLQRQLDVAGSESVSVAGELFPMDRHADWAATPREQLRVRLARNQLEAARACEVRGAWAGALDRARAALQLDVWDEAAALIGMRAALALGNRAAALSIFTGLSRALRDDLNLEPGPELRALAAQVRQG